MGLGRSTVATIGSGLAFGLVFAGGLAARERADYPQTSGGLSFTRLLASRVNGAEIGEGDYFREISELLKLQYVEPVTDDPKLVSGAVRGMIQSLGDPSSIYFSADEFRVFKTMRQGRYEGIGAWLSFEGGKVPAPVAATEENDEEQTASQMSANMPRLTIIATTPDGPAAKAGLKPGDVLEEVAGEWVVNSGPIIEFRQASRDFDAKKIDLPTLNAKRKELKTKLDRSIMPLKARERLMSGTSGSVTLVVLREGKPVRATLEKSRSQVAGFATSGERTALPFVDGAPESLAAFLKGKTKATLDLRGNVLGDFETMRKCLALVAPSGVYGHIASIREGKAPVVSVATGNPKPPKLTLIVDRSTRGAAQIFALALSAKGIAKLSGDSVPMVSERTVPEIVQLGDGSGYTLSTGEFRVGPPPAAKTTTQVKR